MVSLGHNEWQHQAITWTNVDLSSIRFRDIHMSAISRRYLIHQSRITLKITFKTPRGNVLNNDLMPYWGNPLPQPNDVWCIIDAGIFVWFHMAALGMNISKSKPFYLTFNLFLYMLHISRYFLMPWDIKSSCNIYTFLIHMSWIHQIKVGDLSSINNRSTLMKKLALSLQPIHLTWPMLKLF